MSDIVCKIGHKEIDRQHEELELLIGQIDGFCVRSGEEGAACEQCPDAQIVLCRQQASDIVRHLLKFVSMHFRYEQELMRRLPDNEECRDHVRRHQLAHAELSAQISRIAGQLREGAPFALATKIQTVLENWTGAHIAGLDRRMSELHRGHHNGELDDDAELAVLLDRHVHS